MGEAIAVEQFCHVVGAETQVWIRRHNPATLEAAIKLAEDFEDSLVSAHNNLATAPVHWSSGTPPPLSPPSTALGPRPPSSPAPMGNLAPSSWRSRKTNKERRTAKWEGALVRQGWGLVGECCNGTKRQSKGVGTQCDREGEVTGPTRAEVIPAPLNVPDPWYSSADLVWGQKNDPSLVHAWGQVRSIEGMLRSCKLWFASCRWILQTVVCFLSLDPANCGLLPVAGSCKLWFASCRWILQTVVCFLSLDPANCGLLPVAGSCKLWFASCRWILQTVVCFIRLNS
ncbi:UNVERIFIED_CONTAM: hypothetical protein FKN15_012866 [Acipenser sinensis]